jgi:hypothetical protein
MLDVSVVPMLLMVELMLLARLDVEATAPSPMRAAINVYSIRS